MMKKKYNYIIYVVLLIVTIIVTLLLANLYKKEEPTISYSYENLNKINADEFNEYMTEHDDVIIYVGSMYSTSTNKVEKKLISEIEKQNLLENTIFIEKEEINEELEKTLSKDYKYKYNENKLPVLIIVIDGELEKIVNITKKLDYKTAIDYEVFKWLI